MDGLCAGNYFDYDDDAMAIQREKELVEDLLDRIETKKKANKQPPHGGGRTVASDLASFDGTASTDDAEFKRRMEILSGEKWVDESFPASAASLYFDPLNPPKGALPSDSVLWYSLSAGEIEECDPFETKTFVGDIQSPLIQQGALGDSYLVNAMRFLACQPKFIGRLLVSSSYAELGVYTFKFSKAGKWRYVHIDDRIPCRQSGAINFCKNANPYETWAMLLEKAYAKLHGCYEAIANGLIEKVLADLTPAAHIECIRSEKLNPEVICDVVWDGLERGCEENDRLVGCGRFLPDPYGEHVSSRQGISVGHMYQVVDTQVVTADATEMLDAVTVGMVCVRSLQQNNAGRFTGRWSYGHELWEKYPQIGIKLERRTREIQFKRGLGPDPDKEDEDDALAADDASSKNNAAVLKGKAAAAVTAVAGGSGKKSLAETKGAQVAGTREPSKQWQPGSALEAEDDDLNYKRSISIFQVPSSFHSPYRVSCIEFVLVFEFYPTTELRAHLQMTAGLLRSSLRPFSRVQTTFNGFRSKTLSIHLIDATCW